MKIRRAPTKQKHKCDKEYESQVAELSGIAIYTKFDRWDWEKIKGRLPSMAASAYAGIFI